MSATPVEDAPVGEPRMLIDGDLVEAGSGRRFDNLNPATEEVIGEVADASIDDTHRAIAAARRAFDTTTWSTDRALRRRCLEQLHQAAVADQERIRAELVAEVGCPVAVTHLAQLDTPLADGLLWPARMLDEHEWERPLPEGDAFGVPSWRRVVHEPVGV
ncbi:MAG: aldehyde dehydrogenase family protein, partial [Actinomycetes bacterium]